VVYQQMRDPAPAEDPGGGWKLILGLAVGIGAILLGAVAGMGSPTQFSRHTVG
jgi:hypothetical protein